MTERITIKDISKKLKIHHSTVSRALRDSPQVKAETKKRIVKYANKHGYKVNMNALKLRGSVKNVIAVIVPNIHHDFFANIISIITDLAYKNNFIVSVFQTNESLALEKKVVNSVIQNNVAGVIASVSMETSIADHYNALRNYKIPLVMFDRVIDSMDVPKVETDNFGIVAKVVQNLHEEGCKKIVHISGSEDISVFRERMNGFKFMTEKLGLADSKLFIIQQGFTMEKGKQAATALFSKKNKPDAIICDSHLLMTGLISQLNEMEISVPEDVKIVSFSNNPTLHMMQPNIHYIIQPIDEIAKASFELMVKRIQHPDQIHNEQKIFKAKLI